MKTKKFIEKVRDLGYSIQLEDHTQYKWADITIDDDDLIERDKRVVRVSTGWEAWGDLYHMEFSGHNEIELLNVITEYLDTPLEKREEEKKYIYKFPFNVIYETKKDLYVFRILDGGLNLSNASVHDPTVNNRYHFTDKEVEKFAGKDRALFNVCEKIEVTSND